MSFEYNPQVEILLNEHKEERVEMNYQEHNWTMPKAAERPPYFANPKYEWNYPTL